MRRPNFGVEPEPLDYRTVAEAKRLMRGVGGGRPLSLNEAAAILKVRPRDLDLSLWRNLGEEAWERPWD